MRCDSKITTKLGGVDITHECQGDDSNHERVGINHHCHCDVGWRNGKVVERYYQYMDIGCRCFK